MTEQKTFAEQILQFNQGLSSETFNLPTTFKVINPFNGEQKELIKSITTKFYQKFYNDSRPRRMILGSSPARRGSAITGVPFEDAEHLQTETGIFINEFYINQSSQGFLYDVMKKYGGYEKFYTDFYMNFVCPLGLVRINSNNKEVNCNYYEDKKVQEILKPFIINGIKDQISFGIDTSICYCIGSGENYRFLSNLNSEYHFFNQIVPLEHPRYIMQYNSKNKEKFIEKYLNSLQTK